MSIPEPVDHELFVNPGPIYCKYCYDEHPVEIGEDGSLLVCTNCGSGLAPLDDVINAGGYSAFVEKITEQFVRETSTELVNSSMGESVGMDLAHAERLLAKIASTEDALNLVDFAEAARVYAQRAKLGTSAVNHATTVKIRAERKLADMVDAGQEAGTIATKQAHGRGKQASSQGKDASKPTTLTELGIGYKNLFEARLLRDAITEEELVKQAAEADARDRELSRKELVKTAARNKRQKAKRERVEEISNTEPQAITALSRFPVLYVDPPWRYEHSETSTREIENHYPTMSLEQIKGLGVPAADDSVLFLWVTSPKLTEGLEVMAAWGFDYRTCMVWVKDKIGMGYYARQQHELLLIGKRGNLPVPDPEDRPSSVIHGVRGKHSAKPDEAYQLIERMYPLVDKCELFQRRSRDGWVGWGNQA